MDRRGNIVAERDKTSGYCQGDENKFVKSFTGGKGTVIIGETVFYENTRHY